MYVIRENRPHHEYANPNQFFRTPPHSVNNEVVEKMPVLLQTLVKASYAMQFVFYIPFQCLMYSSFFLLMWYLPTFFSIAIDNLSKKLYEPLQKESSWIVVTRSFQVLPMPSRVKPLTHTSLPRKRLTIQVLNAVLMRMGNVTSKSISFHMTICTFILLVSIMRVRSLLSAAVETTQLVSAVFGLISFWVFILVTMVNLCWVTVKASRLNQLLMTQDVTAWSPQSTSLRVMLFLPSCGWRVHHTLVSPAVVATTAWACVSSILYVLWDAVGEQMLDDLLDSVGLELGGANSTRAIDVCVVGCRVA